MPVCLECKTDNPPGGKFCSECGAKLPQPVVAPSGSDGDIVAVRSTVIKTGSMVFGESQGSRYEDCPICGKYNDPKDTFRCKKCGRSYLCLEHRHPQTRWCEECAQEQVHALEFPPAAGGVKRVEYEPVERSPRAGDTRINEKDGSVMVYIPSGEFLMGSLESDPEAYPNEKPQHKIYLDGYWIDKCPVTNVQFARFVKETGYEWDWFVADKDNHPVVNVSWNDALAYCRWSGKRLPTEAEWEKAARGADGRKYPWGEVLTPGHANYDWTVGGTTPVGSYPDGASPYGVLDMAGNVMEWVSDWYDNCYYKNSPSRNPAGPAVGKERALRGGSWVNDSRYVRSADRHWDVPVSWQGDFGFRCSRSK